MPLHLVSPFDDEGEFPPGQAAAAPPARPWRQPLADLCFILIKAGAYLGSIYLMVLGLPLLFFLAMTGGDMNLLFAQIGNLAAHYVAADAARQMSFANEIKLCFLGIATFAAIWRLPRFLDEVAHTLSPRSEEQ